VQAKEVDTKAESQTSTETIMKEDTAEMEIANMQQDRDIVSLQGTRQKGLAQHKEMLHRMRQQVQRDNEKGYAVRQSIFVNINGAMPKFKKWHAEGGLLMETMKNNNITMLGLAEAKIPGEDKTKLKKGGQFMSETLALRVGGTWDVHVVPGTAQGQAGVAVCIKRDDWQYRIHKGLDEMGRPVKNQDNDDNNKQGRYIIVEAATPGDIDDYMFVYAPNSGTRGQTMEAQRLMAEAIERAMRYATARGRRLNVLGDLNFSHKEDRRMKHDHNISPQDILKEAGLPDTPGIRDEETKIAKETYLATQAVDMEKEWAKRNKRTCRTTTELDFRQLEGGKHLKRHKAQVRMNFVLCSSKGWLEDDGYIDQETKIRGGTDTTMRTLPKGYTYLEYMEFDSTLSDEITSGTDHSTIYIAKRVRRGDSNEGLMKVLALSSKYVMMRAAQDILNHKGTVDEELVTANSKAAVTAIQSMLTAVDRRAQQRHGRANRTSTREQANCTWKSTIYWIKKIQEQLPHAGSTMPTPMSDMALGRHIREQIQAIQGQWHCMFQAGDTNLEALSHVIRRTQGDYVRSGMTARQQINVTKMVHALNRYPNGTYMTVLQQRKKDRQGQALIIKTQYPKRTINGWKMTDDKDAKVAKEIHGDHKQREAGGSTETEGRHETRRNIAGWHMAKLLLIHRGWGWQAAERIEMMISQEMDRGQEKRAKRWAKALQHMATQVQSDLAHRQRLGNKALRASMQHHSHRERNNGPTLRNRQRTRWQLLLQAWEQERLRRSLCSATMALAGWEIWKQMGAQRTPATYNRAAISAAIRELCGMDLNEAECAFRMRDIRWFHQMDRQEQATANLEVWEMVDNACEVDHGPQITMLETTPNIDKKWQRLFTMMQHSQGGDDGEEGWQTKWRIHVPEGVDRVGLQEDMREAVKQETENNGTRGHTRIDIRMDEHHSYGHVLVRHEGTLTTQQKHGIQAAMLYSAMKRSCSMRQEAEKHTSFNDRWDYAWKVTGLTEIGVVKEDMKVRMKEWWTEADTPKIVIMQCDEGKHEIVITGTKKPTTRQRTRLDEAMATTVHNNKGQIYHSRYSQRCRGEEEWSTDQHKESTMTQDKHTALKDASISVQAVVRELTQQRKRSRIGACIRCGNQILTTQEGDLPTKKKQQGKTTEKDINEMLQRLGVNVGNMKAALVKGRHVHNIGDTQWELWDLAHQEVPCGELVWTHIPEATVQAWTHWQKQEGTEQVEPSHETKATRGVNAKMLKHLTENPVQDRWMWDKEWHMIKQDSPEARRFGETLKQLERTIRRQECDEEMCSIIHEEKLRDKEHETKPSGGVTLPTTLHVRRNIVERRKICLQQEAKPLTMWAWIGSVDDPAKRKRIKVLWDSGCSLIAMSSNLAKELKRYNKDMEIDTHAGGKGARSAFGNVMQTEGTMEFGLTIPNLEFKTDNHAAAQLDVHMKAWVYDDLSYDLILGTPMWYDWVERIEWGTIKEDPNAHDILHLMDSEGQTCQVAITSKAERRKHTKAIAILNETVEFEEPTAWEKTHKQNKRLVRVLMQQEGPGYMDTAMITPLPQTEGGCIMATEQMVQMKRCEQDGAYEAEIEIMWIPEKAETLIPGTLVACAMLGGSQSPPQGGNDSEDIKGDTFDTKQIYDLQWYNEGLTRTRHNGMRAQAESYQGILYKAAKDFVEGLPHETKAKGDQTLLLWSMAQKLYVREIMEGWLDRGMASTNKDPEALGAALTWVTCLIDAMPHLTVDILKDARWVTILNRATMQPGAEWKAAQNAAERLFVLLKAFKAGYRQGERDAQIKVITDEGFTEATDLRTSAAFGLAPWTSIARGQNLLRKYNEEAWRKLTGDKYILTGPQQKGLTWSAGDREVQQAMADDIASCTLMERTKEKRQQHDRYEESIRGNWSKAWQEHHIMGLSQDVMPAEQAAEHYKEIYDMDKEQKRKEAFKTLEEKCKENPQDFDVKDIPMDYVDEVAPGGVGQEQPRTGFGTIEDRPPPDTTPQWLEELTEEDELYDLWHNGDLSERAKRYIKLIEFGEPGKMIQPENETEEAKEKARKQERTFIHMLVYHIGIKNVAEFDIDPWCPPVLKTVTFDERFLTLITPSPVYDPPRPLNKAVLEQALEQTQQMIDAGLVYIGVSPFNANIVAVPKPMARGETVRKYRITVDMRAINSKTVRMDYSFGSTFDALENTAGFDIYNSSDACAGFHQISVDPAIQYMLSYSAGPLRVTPVCMSMGGVNSASCFNYALSRCVGHMKRGCCDLTKRNREIKKRQLIQERQALRREREKDMTGEDGKQSAVLHAGAGDVAEKDDRQQKDGKQLTTQQKPSATAEGRVIDGLRTGTQQAKATHAQRMEEEMTKDQQVETPMTRQYEEKEMERWERLAKETQLGSDGRFTTELGEACAGIPMTDIRHQCFSELYVDDVLQPIDLTETGTKFSKLCGTIICLRNLLEQMDQHGIRLKAQKTSLVMQVLKFLGWTVSSDGLQPSDDKRKGIRNLSTPVNVSDVRTLTGSLQYFRRSIPGCSTIEAPLHELCKKGVDFQWGEAQEKAAQDLKDILCSDAIMAAPPNDPAQEIIIITDVSSVGIGCVLAVKDKDTGEERPCWYDGTTLTARQRELSASEREMLGIRFACTRFEKFLALGRKVTLVTDHSSLKHCIERRSQNVKLNNWSLALMHLDVGVQVRKGVHATIAIPDMISRLNPYASIVRDEVTGKLTTHQSLKLISGEKEQDSTREGEVKGVENLLRLAGPKEIDRTKAAMPQNKRRLCRKMLQMAYMNLDQEKGRAHTSHEKCVSNMKAIEKLMSTQASDIAEGNTTDPRNRAEEAVIEELGGFRQLCNMALGESLEEAKLKVTEFDEVYGDGWEQRMYLYARPDQTKGRSESAEATGLLEKVYGIDIYEQEDKGTMHEILKEMMPEENIPPPSTDPSFMMTMDMATSKEPETTERCQQEICPMMADLFTGSAVVSQAYKDMRWTIGTTCEKAHQQQKCIQHLLGQEPIRDIRQVEARHLAGHFLVFASPPCQAFSKSGHRSGWNDERGNHFTTTLPPIIEAGVPVIVIENVPDVMTKMQHPDGRKISPYEEARTVLTQAGYVVGYQEMNAGEYGGWVSRDRIFIQAIRADLLDFHGGIEGVKRMINATVRQRVTAQDGLIWPQKQPTMKKLRDILMPWHEVDDIYKLGWCEWGKWQFRPGMVKQMQRWCTRMGDNFMGGMHNPNMWISSEGLGASITAFGNTRYVVWIDKNEETMGVRRMTPEECMLAMGVAKDLPLSEGDHWGYEIAGGAVSRHVAEALAECTRLYYDPEYMQQHVKNMRQRHTWYGQETERDNCTQITQEATQNMQAVDDFRVRIDRTATEEQNIKEVCGRATAYENAQAQRALQAATSRAVNMVRQILGENRVTSLQQQTYKKRREQRRRIQEGNIASLKAHKHMEMARWKPPRKRDRKRAQEQQNTPLGGMPLQEEEDKIDTEQRRIRQKIDVLSKGKKKIETITVTEADPKATATEIRAACNKTDWMVQADDNEEQLWRTFRDAQRKDVDLRTLAEYCEEGIVPECPIRRDALITKDKYVTREGVLYRINESRKIPEEAWLQLCVPRELQARLIEEYHNQMAHPPAEQMCRALRQRYHWDRMMHECQVYVQYCDACQRYRANKPRMGTTGFTQIITEVGCPGHTIQMDVIGPYGTEAHKTTKGNRSALVIQDEFTRFVQVYPTDRVTSEFVHKCIHEWCRYIGRPQRITSDRAANLISKGLQTYYEAAGITKTESSSLHPQSHGKVESMNRFITNRLRTKLAGKTKDWDLHIESVAEAYNKSPSVALGYRSPHWMMFGRRAYSAFEREYGVKLTDENYVLQDWVKRGIKQLQLSWEAQSEASIQYKLDILKHAQQRWKEAEPTKFNKGDLVKIFLATAPAEKGMARKLLGRWTTEYEIAEKAGRQTYTVHKKFAGDGKVSVPIHVSRIKPYYCSENANTTPLTKMHPTTRLQEANETRITEAQSDELLDITQGNESEETKDEFDKDERKQFQRSLKENIPDTIQTGWDVPLSKEERKQEYMQTEGIKAQTEQEADELGTGSDELLVDRDSFDMAMPELMRDSEDEDSEEEGQIKDGEDNGELQLGYKMEDRSTSLAKVAKKLKLRVSTLVSLNQDLFYEHVTENTKIPKGCIIRVQYPKMTAAEEKSKDAAATKMRIEGISKKFKQYRRKDMGDHNKSWGIKRIQGKRIQQGRVQYQVVWDPKDLMEGDDPCSWIDETQLACARTALKEFKDKESQKKAGVKPVEQVLAITMEEGSIINALITGSDDGIPRKITGVTIKENPKLAAEAQTLIEDMAPHATKQPAVLWDTGAEKSEWDIQALQNMTNRPWSFTTKGWTQLMRQDMTERPGTVAELETTKENDEDVENMEECMTDRDYAIITGLTEGQEEEQYDTCGDTVKKMSPRTNECSRQENKEGDTEPTAMTPSDAGETQAVPNMDETWMEEHIINRVGDQVLSITGVEDKQQAQALMTWLRQNKNVWAIHLGNTAGLKVEDWQYIITTLPSTNVATVGCYRLPTTARIRGKILNTLAQNRIISKDKGWCLQSGGSLEAVLACRGMLWDPNKCRKNQRWIKMCIAKYAEHGQQHEQEERMGKQQRHPLRLVVWYKTQDKMLQAICPQYTAYMPKEQLSPKQQHRAWKQQAMQGWTKDIKWVWTHTTPGTQSNVNKASDGVTYIHRVVLDSTHRAAMQMALKAQWQPAADISVPTEEKNEGRMHKEETIAEDLQDNRWMQASSATGTKEHKVLARKHIRPGRIIGCLLDGAEWTTDRQIDEQQRPYSVRNEKGALLILKGINKRIQRTQTTQEANCRMNRGGQIQVMDNLSKGIQKGAELILTLDGSGYSQGTDHFTQTDESRPMGGQCTAEEEIQLDKDLRNMEVQVADQAAEYLKKFETRHGQDKTCVYRERKVYGRFQQSLNLLADRVERSKDQEMEMIKGAILSWDPNYEATGMMDIILSKEQIGQSKSEPAVDAEVIIEYMEGNEKRKLNGMVKRMETLGSNNEGRRFKVKINKREDTPDATRGDIGVSWKGANCLRIKRAIQDVWGTETPEGEHGEHIKAVRDVLLSTNGIPNVHDMRVINKHYPTWRMHMQRISPSQLAAIDDVLKKRISLIRGPPGTGKTTTISLIVSLVIYAYRQEGIPAKVILSTPTNNTAQDLVCKLAGMRMPPAPGQETTENDRPMDVSWIVARSFKSRVKEEAESHTIGHKAIHSRGPDMIETKTLRELHMKVEKGQRLDFEQEKYYKILHKQAIKREIDKTEVIVGTIHQAGLKLLKEKKFHMAIVDEAGLIEEASISLPMALGPEKLVLVGDEHQMRARQITAEGKRLKVDPLFHRVVKQQHITPSMLMEHWRMCRACIQPVNELFYEGKLTVAEEIEQSRVMDLARWGIFKDPKVPRMWIDVKGQEAKMKDHTNKSTKNELEANVCVQLAKWLLGKTKGEATEEDIAIVASYSAQVDQIQKLLQDVGLTKVQVGTTEKWQGGERKFVIISTTRTQYGMKGEFIKDSGRICVNASRCTHAYFMVGHKEAMRTAGETWAAIIPKIKHQQGQLTEDIPGMPRQMDRDTPMGGSQQDTGEIVWLKDQIYLNMLVKWRRILTGAYKMLVDNTLLKTKDRVQNMKSFEEIVAEAEGRRDDEMKPAEAADTERSTDCTCGKDECKACWEAYKIKADINTKEWLKEERHLIMAGANMQGNARFIVYLNQEIRVTTRERMHEEATAKDVRMMDPFGFNMGITPHGLAYKDEGKGLQDVEEESDTGHKVLALALGDGPSCLKDWVNEKTRRTVGAGILQLPQTARTLIWHLHQGGFSTKPDIVNKRKDMKHERAIKGASQGFKGRHSINTAALESLKRPQPACRISSIIDESWANFEDLRRRATEWKACEVQRMADQQLARLWKGRRKVNTVNITRRDDADRQCHQRQRGNTAEKYAAPDEAWDIGLVMVIAADMKLTTRKGWWYDKDTRGQVFKEVGQRWHRQENMPKGYLGWLLETQREQFINNTVRMKEECETETILAPQVVERMRRNIELFQDKVIQRNGGKWKDYRTGMYIGLRHPNPTGLKWNEDRHGRKVRLGQECGKEYEIQQPRIKGETDEAEEENLMACDVAKDEKDTADPTYRDEKDEETKLINDERTEMNPGQGRCGKAPKASLELGPGDASEVTNVKGSTLNNTSNAQGTVQGSCIGPNPDPTNDSIPSTLPPTLNTIEQHPTDKRPSDTPPETTLQTTVHNDREMEMDRTHSKEDREGAQSNQSLAAMDDSSKKEEDRIQQKRVENVKQRGTVRIPDKETEKEQDEDAGSTADTAWEDGENKAQYTHTNTSGGQNKHESCTVPEYNTEQTEVPDHDGGKCQNNRTQEENQKNTTLKMDCITLQDQTSEDKNDRAAPTDEAAVDTSPASTEAEDQEDAHTMDGNKGARLDLDTFNSKLADLNCMLQALTEHIESIAGMEEDLGEYIDSQEPTEPVIGDIQDPTQTSHRKESAEGTDSGTTGKNTTQKLQHVTRTDTLQSEEDVGPEAAELQKTVDREANVKEGKKIPTEQATTQGNSKKIRQEMSKTQEKEPSQAADVEGLAAVHETATSSTPAQTQSERMEIEGQLIQTNKGHENKTQEEISREQRQYQRPEEEPMTPQEPAQRPTQDIQEPEEKGEIKAVMEGIRDTHPTDNKEDNFKKDPTPLPETLQAAMKQVEATNKDGMYGDENMDCKESWGWEGMKTTCADQNPTYDPEETFEIVGKADKANRRFNATIFKNKNTWIYQNVVFRFNDVTVYEYTERWKPGNRKENDSFNPIWTPALDGKPYQTGKTDFFAMMWQWEEPTDLQDKNWTQSKDKKLISGDLQCKKGTMKIPAQTKVIGRWLQNRPTAPGKWRIGELHNNEVTEAELGETYPMTMWIHRLMEKSLKGKDKVRYTYEGAEYGDACKFHKAIEDWLIAPGETMGINMSLYCDDAMENDREQRWPTRKAWWRGTAETGEKLVFVILRTDVISKIEEQMSKIPGYKKIPKSKRKQWELYRMTDETD